MAVNEFTPAALEVAQVSKATVGGTLSGEDFEISVGGVLIASHTDADTVIATTVAALVAAWNASTHPYATQITATDSSPDVVLTSDVAGLPFEITLNTPGGSATFVETEPTANEGPNNWESAANWSLGTVPAATDDVVIDSQVDICWGIMQQSITIASLDIRKNRSRIGLRAHQFATQVNGRVYDASVPEYRPTYLDIQITAAGMVRIGSALEGLDNKIASDRIKLDLGTSNVNMEVHNLNATPAELGMPSMRYLGIHASMNMIIYAGSVGVAVDSPGETATVREVELRGASARVYLSVGVTWANVRQYQGLESILDAAASPGDVQVDNGTVRLEGNWDMTGTVTVNGGTLKDNHGKTGGSATTVNLNGGTIDVSDPINYARVYDVLNWEGGKIIGRKNALTITALNLPDERSEYWELEATTGV